MSNEKDLIDEKSVPGNWESVEVKPIIPGTASAGASAPPVPNEMPQFFSGSLSPFLQHDTSFVGTEVGTPRIPKTSLMPFGLQNNPSLQSMTQTIVNNSSSKVTDVPFGGITTGDNTGALMRVAGLSELTYFQTGIVNANEIGGIDVAGNVPGHAGQLLISQPGNVDAVWADPQVQGLYASGDSINSPPAYAAPTTIQPVLIGGQNPSNLLENVRVDASQNLLTAVNAPLPVGTNQIGHVVTDSGSTTAVTGNVTVVQPTGTNLHAVLDSGTLTSITNPVTVAQAIAANLNATVVGTGTFAVQDAAAETSLATLASTVVNAGSPATPAVKVDIVSSAINANTNLTEVGGAPIFLGATIMADSVPMTFATDQSPLGVTGSVSATGTITANIGTTGGLALDASVTNLQKDAESASSTVNPVQFGGVDSNGKVRKAVASFFGGLEVGPCLEAGDAFGRFRVSNPQTLFDAQFQYDTQPLFFVTSLTGTGTVTKTSGESSLTLSTGGTVSGAQAINQTKQYFRYEPGKSQYVAMTGLLGAPKTNVRSRIGYFDANDGCYFEQAITGPSVNVRSSTTGSAVNTTIPQASWNLDKMDGTGVSGVTTDFSKTQIFVIDLQWLGVGKIRFGFFTSGQLVYCHEVFNDNAVVSPYMNTANLPCRGEITNTGTAASTTTMKQICITIISEGGEDRPSVFNFTANNGTTSISGSSNTRRPVLSIQVKTTFNSITNRSKIEVRDLDLSIASQACLWELVLNPTLTGASFASAGANSGVNFDVAATALSGGTVIASGYASAGTVANRLITSASVQTLLPFTLDFAGTTGDIMTIAFTPLGGSATVFASIDWDELR